ncbi:MAG: DHHA1 domain-containing protein, partial [Euryarchaeota archaeon]|nr:DHHA1 domain-containing protein [Euryarchaeota archaeon]
LSILHQSANEVKVTPEHLPETVHRFFTEWKQLKKENARLKEELATARVGAMLSDCMDINGLKVVAKNIPGADIEELIKAAAEFSKMPDVIAVLASDLNGAKLVAAAGKKAVEQGVNSGVIVKEMCKVVSGGGGGR